MTAQYPGDIEPQPVMVYAAERLCSEIVGGPFAPLLLRDPANGTTYFYPFTDDHLPSGYLTALSGKSYLEIVRVNNQRVAIGALLQHVSTAGRLPPRMRDTIKIGPSPSLIFNGGTDVGNVYSLDIQPSIEELGIKASNFTAIAVLRASSSMFRNQSSAPALSDGTILSLDAIEPIIAIGTTTAGTNVITGVTPSAGIAPGMRVDGPPFPFGGIVATVTPSGPTSCTITIGDFGANQSLTGQLIFSNPMMRLYQAGDSSPGSFAMSDHRAPIAAFGWVTTTLQPKDFSGVEVNPVVVSWVSNSDAARDVVGQKIYMNEIVRSSSAVSPRPEVAKCGFVGTMGGSQFGAFSRAGDFQLAALLVWDRALTQAQRTIVCDALYQRYGIVSKTSTRTTKSFAAIGESVTAEYRAFGNYGWLKRLADKFNGTVRALNYAVPGDQITASFTSPAGLSCDQMFPISMAAHIDYSKLNKNVLFIWGAANDIVANVGDMNYSIDVATDQVSIYSDRATTAVAAAGGNVLTMTQLATPFAFNVAAGATVENLTTPASIPAGTTVVSSDTFHVTLSAAIAAPGVGNGDVIRLRWHNLAANTRIWFTSQPLDPITFVPTLTGVNVNTTYYVKTLASPFKFTIAATPGGAAINIGGTFSGTHSCLLLYKTGATIFGTPTTEGIQKIVADANAAGASKVYVMTMLPVIGEQYQVERTNLNALIMGGGAGGYTAIDIASNAAWADHNVPPGHQGANFADAGHLNDPGSQAAADIVFPILNAYLNS